ncbi:MAG: hypothetical protein Ta2B_21550 [Termitinemataceae bacterium]|nr:MAG: hypothetical protein Ta2B_21550 [Termitinemataceae bacterium]
MGGGGNLTTLLNHPLKAGKRLCSPLLTVAALIAASLLVTACPAPDDAVDGGSLPRPANSNPSVQLSKLLVTYGGTSSAANLINFDSASDTQEGEYTVLDTDSTKATIKLEAETKSADAYVRIWWTNGDNGGGMGIEETAKKTKVLENIPVPSTEDNTYIYVNVTNGDNEPYEYLITITPPAVDTTLASLQVTIDSVQADYTFNAKVTQYDIHSPAGKAGKTIVVTGVANAATDGATVSYIYPDGVTEASLKVPEDGGAPIVIKVAVTNGISEEREQGMTSIYVVNIIPAQNTLIDDARIMMLQFEYIYPAVDKPNQAAFGGNVFNADQNVYTLNVSEGATKVKMSILQPASSNATYTAGTGESYTNYTPDSELNLPSKGSEAVLTFNIMVTAQNTNVTRPYTITFSNPKKFVSYSGSVVLSPPAPVGTTIVFDHIEAESAGGVNSTLINHEGGNDLWSISLDDRYPPTAFVAVMKRKVGSDPEVTIRQSFVPVANKQTAITLSVELSKTSRIIYNAVDFKAIGQTGNNTENWYMANDITLPNEAAGWVGPIGYSGKFYGNGKTIKNLSLAKTDANSTYNGSPVNKSALFAGLSGSAELSDFTIEVATASTLGMETNTFFGGVVGFIDDDVGDIKIKNITVNGDLSYGEISDHEKWFIVGGLLGQINTTSGTVTIENCVSNLNIEANIGNKFSSTPVIFTAAGGLIGHLCFGTATIKNSYATGNITLTSSADRTLFAGGLIGVLAFNEIRTANYTISNCYASGTVTVSGNSATTKDISGGSLIGGGSWRIAEVTGTASIANSAALGNTVLVSGSAAAVSGRVLGITVSQITLANNIANGAMLVGTDPANKAEVSGGTLTNTNGLNVNLSSGHSAILDVLNAGYGANPVWEYKSGAALPSLK